VRIGIVLHRQKEPALELAGELVDWMRARDVQPLMLSEEAEAIGRAELGEAGPLSDADVVVTLGGDGTLLRGARHVLGTSVPVFGINLGRLGFLAEVDKDETWPAMEKVLARQYRVQERSVLRCDVFAGERRVTRCLAVNEIVVGRGARNRLLNLPVEINGDIFNHYYCDGLILSTPTGSTAYSLSAGGPFVSPETNLFILTPICPHSLLSRSLILAESDIVSIRLPGRLGVEAHTDGEEVRLPAEADRIEVSSAPERFYLARVHEHSFFTVLRRKLAIWDSPGEER